jgi:tripartite ATP-independent transporter DctP family solute receptor
MKRHMTPTSCLGALLVFASALAVSHVASAQVPVRLAYVTQKTHSFGVGATAFIDKLTELTGDRYAVKEFPAGALGGERENVEQLQAGALEVSITTSGVLANFVPAIGIVDVPFLFRDYEHAHAVLDSELGDGLIQQLEPIGIVGMCWGESGFRQVYTNNGPVRSPKDLEGIKIRTMEVPEHILAFKSVGARPTAIAFPEVFTALQQGTVDAAEGPAQTMLSNKFYEVQKYLSFTNHLYAASLVLMSKNFFDGLSAEDQAAFRAAAKASCDAQRTFVINGEKSVIKKLEDLGVTVTLAKDIDRAAFDEALKPAYEEYAKKFGADLLNRFKNYGE